MLTELAIKAAKPAAKIYRLTDGQSLYLPRPDERRALVAVGLSPAQRQT